MLPRHQIVHHGKDGLFDFTDILGAANQQQFLPKVDRDEHFRTRAIHFRVGVKTGGIKDGELRNVIQQFFGLGLDEHIVCKQTVPRGFRNHADRQAILWVGTHEAILHEQIFALQIGEHAPVQCCKFLRLHRAINFAPPHLVNADWLAHDELVVGRTTSMLTRADDERTQIREPAFAAANRLFVQ